MKNIACVNCAPPGNGHSGVWRTNSGAHDNTINAIETEKYDPSLPLAFKVARLFKQAIEELFEPDPGGRVKLASGKQW